jgi:hypothetical protein
MREVAARCDTVVIVMKAANWLWTAVAAAAVATTTVTVSAFKRPAAPAATPADATLELVPADAAVVVRLADCNALAAKTVLAFDWVAPVFDMIGAKLTGMLLGSPWPAWMVFVPDPFAKAAYTIGKAQAGHDPKEIVRQGMLGALRMMLDELRNAGVDTSRPVVLFAYARRDALEAYEKAARAGGKPPAELPLSWVHCVPTRRGATLDYGSLCQRLSPDPSQPAAQWKTLRHDSYSLACMDHHALHLTEKHLRDLPGRKHSLEGALSASGRRFLLGHDVALLVREPAAFRAARPSQAPRDAMEAQLEKFAEELDALGAGALLTDDGVQASIYAGCRRRGKIGEALAAYDPPERPLAASLPANARLIAQTGGDARVMTTLVELLGLEGAVANAFVEDAAFAVVPMSAKGLLETVMSAMSSGGNTPLATPLPAGVVCVTRVKSAAEYQQRQQQVGSLLQECARVADDGAGRPAVRISPGAGGGLDRIAVPLPGMAKALGPQAAALEKMLDLAVVSTLQGRGRPMLAGFATGMGAPELLQESLALAGSRRGGIGDTDVFQWAWQHAPRHPLLAVAGPFMKPGEDLLGSLAGQFAAALTGAQSEPGEPDAQPIIALAALGAEPDALRLDVFASGALCCETVKGVTRGALSMLGIGKWLFMSGGDD